jgi:hypothetical protein
MLSFKFPTPEFKPCGFKDFGFSLPKFESRISRLGFVLLSFRLDQLEEILLHA